MKTDISFPPHESLTPRQQEVLHLIRLGLTDAEIAERLGISLKGASKHVSEIIGKLGVRNRYEAAAWPEPPWWAAALAPVAVVWRHARAMLPAKAGGVAAVASAGTMAAVPGGMGLVAVLLVPAGAGNDGLGGTKAAAAIEADGGGGGLVPQQDLNPPPEPLATPLPGDGAPDARAAYHGDSNDDGSTSQLQQAAGPSTPTPVPTPFGNGAMAIDCDASLAGVQTSCVYPGGSTFAVQVQVPYAPAAGYGGFDVKVRWDAATLGYLPKADPADEALWEECDIPVRMDNQSLGEPSVLFACVPFPAPSVPHTSAGPMLQFALSCQREGTTALALVPRAGDPQHGTHFLTLQTDPIDPALAGAQVACGPCPPGGCPPPPLPSPSPTPNPAPGPRPCPVIDEESGFPLMAELSLTDGRTQFAQGEPITMGLAITNQSDEAVSRSYSSGQDYDFVVCDAAGYEIWRWSSDKVFVLWLEGRIFQLGATTTYVETWSQVDYARKGVPPGTYSVVGYDVGCSDVQPPAQCNLGRSLTFEIVP
jgi:DNA-binding CsgD family transcriptional regulator